MAATGTGTQHKQAATDGDVDILRDTPVRLLGYANEVGEAFRALVHVRWVRLSYGVASAYVLTDTVDKAARMRSSLDPADAARTRKVAAAAFDTLLWQALASVAVPGLTINRLCALSLFALARLAPAVPLVTRKWITTAVGLGAIPFIVHPIDSGVHFAMDKTTRVWLGGVPDKTH